MADMLRQGPLTGGETKRLIRSLPDTELDFVAATVAEHLRRCRWRQLPPDPPATGDQFPGAAQGGDRPVVDRWLHLTYRSPT